MTLKEFEKLVKICRKAGVESARIDGVELHLGPPPTSTPQAQRKQRVQEAINEFNQLSGLPVQITQQVPDPIETDELSPEELLFYSTGNEQA